MLKYDTLVSEALKAIPEFKAEYDKLISADIIDAESGNHIVFGFTFVPVLLSAIQDGNESLRDSMLAIVEQMASSEDRLVVEVCDYSILEALNDHVEDSVLMPLLGEQTRIGFDAIKRYMR